MDAVSGPLPPLHPTLTSSDIGRCTQVDSTPHREGQRTIDSVVKLQH